MELNIRTIGDPILRQISQPLSRSELEEPSLQEFIDAMIECMRANGGAGLAAVQVGRPVRICVLEVNTNERYPYMPALPLRVLVNPELELLDQGTVINFDGCLSVPDLRGPVERPLALRVRAWDRHGQDFQAVYYGLAAVIVSHECDHLDGCLFTDKLTDPRELCSWAHFQTRHQQQEADKWTRLQATWPEPECPEQAT